MVKLGMIEKGMSAIKIRISVGRNAVK